MTRSQIREHIFTILFRIDFTDKDEFDEQIAFAMETIDDLYAPTKSEADYMRNKTADIYRRLSSIDCLIDTHAKGWKIGRIGKAELTILRLAVYEMRYEDEIPVRVAINEACELSKIYCDEEAKGFINAVLGNIERADLPEEMR